MGKRWKCKLEVLTPLHIGSEGKILPTQYVLNGDRIYVMKPEKMSEYLISRGLFDEYVRLAREGRGKLTEFLTKYGVRLEEVLKEGMFYYSARRKVMGEEKEIMPCIKNPFFKPYIPGSTIKGMLRTAVMFRYLDKEGPGLWIRKVREKLNRPPQKKPAPKKFDDDFYLFDNFQLVDGVRWGPNTDIFRALKVSDTGAWDGEIEIWELRVVHVKKGEQSPMWVEVIPEGAVLEFEVWIDDMVLEYFKRADRRRAERMEECMLNWMDAVREFTGRVNEKMQKIWNERLRLEDGDMRLGWGKGFFWNTLGVLLEESQVMKIRNWYYSRSRGDRFPLSVRMLEDGRLPGWVNLECLES